MFRNAVSNGFASEGKGSLTLTEKGLAWVDHDRLMANQPDKQGSEEHKRLVRKTIVMLQDRMELAIVSSEKHAFDVLGIPVNSEMPSRWDPSRAKGYEAQTTARADSIAMNRGKTKRWGVPMVWVCGDKNIMCETKKLSGATDTYILLSPDGFEKRINVSNAI